MNINTEFVISNWTVLHSEIWCAVLDIVTQDAGEKLHSTWVIRGPECYMTGPRGGGEVGPVMAPSNLYDELEYSFDQWSGR